jgi:hypothetical protein
MDKGFVQLRVVAEHQCHSAGMGMAHSADDSEAIAG